LQTSEEPAAAGEKKKVIKTDLHVTSQTASFPEEELEKLVRLENEYANKDKAFKDRADKRNELEEFIYAARSDVEEKLKQYATAEEAAKLKAKLDEDEAWMYEEEGENANFQQLSARLAALHTPYDAIQNRLLEIDARTASAERLSQQVQQYLSVANSVSPDHAHITEEERKKVRAACDEVLNWLTSQQEAQGKLPLNKDPVLTASTIDDKVHKLKQDCRAIVEKPKPKPAEPAKKEEKKTKAAPAPEPEAKPAAEEKMEVDGEDKKAAPAAEDGAKMDVEELE
jgi:molecular chaperone DnaK (HSP70)